MPLSAVSQESATAAVAPSSSLPFTAIGHESTAPGTPLTAPISITYGGGSPVVLLTNTGSNKGVESVITNSKNQTSALYGATSGSGAGVAAYNTGVTGPAGKFNVTDKASQMSALVATTAGIGSAIVGTVTTTGKAYGSGVLGISNATDGTGVSGYATDDFSAGVYGNSENGTGVSAESTEGTGLFAISDDGPYGIVAIDDYGTGIYAYTDTGTSLFAYAETQGVGITVSTYQGDGIDVKSIEGPAIYAVSDSTYAIWGQSMDAVGVMGEDSGSGYGIYGSSVSGYAGYFDGSVAATSFVTLSDRDAKTNLQPVDGGAILDRISHLPISSWDFKTDLAKRHVGPMAQDFHAAFGLGGQDDTHINLADIAGVSLAAIQELNTQLQVKDAQIADLTSQLSAQSRAVAELRSLAEQLAVRMSSIEHR